MNFLKKQVYDLYYKYFLNKVYQILANQNDVLANQYLAPLSQFYLPWSQSSMRPSGLVAVLNDIIINKRSCIVECGAGISTFYIARLLKEKGGHLYTIEHEEGWVDFLSKELEGEGIDSYVSIVWAPLIATELGLEKSLWYDTEIIREKIPLKEIDLLLIDGPPAYKKDIQYARYPAVPYFHQFLASDYTVILDDINRLAEQEILNKWEEYLDIKFERRFLEGNIAIGRSKPLFTL